MECADMCSAKAVLETLLKHDFGTSLVVDQVFARPTNSLGKFIEVTVESPNKDFHQSVSIIAKLVKLAPEKWIEDYIHEVTKSTKVEDKLHRLISVACAPFIKDLKLKPCEKSDVPSVSERAESVLALVRCLLSIVTDHDKTKPLVLCLLPHLLILITEHEQPNLWTSTVSLSLSKEVLTQVEEILSVSSHEDLLQYRIASDQKGSVLFHIIKYLSERLTRDSWMCYPSLKVVYRWVVFHTRFPNMSEAFPKFLPTALLFIDDHILENKILGVSCLYHIMQNTSREELRWYGQADVIYEALKHQMYTREPKLIDVLHPALLYILSVVEKDPQYCTDSKGLFRVPNKYDEVFHTILTDAYGEQNLALRIALTGHLTHFVEKLGLLAVRHNNLIFKVIEEYLEVYDGKRHSAKPQILRLLKSMIVATWPRMSRYVDFILKILVKLLIDISSRERYDMELVHTIEELSTQCLILIKHVNLEYVEKQLQNIIKLDIPNTCKLTLSDALQLSM